MANLNLMKKMFYNKDGEFSKWATAGTVANVGFSISDYNDSRNEGNGVLGSALSAGANFALMNMIGTVPSLLMGFARPLAEGAVSTFDNAQMYGRQLDRINQNHPFANSTFVDTQQTYTMRQAGMNLAKQSKYAVQQAMLGNEARRMVTR